MVIDFNATERRLNWK